MPIDNIIPSRT